MNTITRNDSREWLNKVPEVTLFFWIIKIMATTIGETGADFLNFDLNFGLTGTSLVMASLLVVFQFLQLRGTKYVPWLYWTNVLLISVVGTLITDKMVDNYGVALQAACIVFGLALIATFAAWYLSEDTLSIHSIFTPRRELFYWAAILFTFALGTAAGDLAAEGLDLGYATSALIFGALIAAIGIGYFLFDANPITSFWLAYILTRPFGASCGDLLSQPVSAGGLGLGTAGTSLIFLATILGLVVYLTRSGKDAARAVANQA